LAARYDPGKGGNPTQPGLTGQREKGAINMELRFILDNSGKLAAQKPEEDLINRYRAVEESFARMFYSWDHFNNLPMLIPGVHFDVPPIEYPRRQAGGSIKLIINVGEPQP
jgi:hypothetical protein